MGNDRQLDEASGLANKPTRLARTYNRSNP